MNPLDHSNWMTNTEKYTHTYMPNTFELNTGYKLVLVIKHTLNNKPKQSTSNCTEITSLEWWLFKNVVLRITLWITGLHCSIFILCVIICS